MFDIATFYKWWFLTFHICLDCLTFLPMTLHWKYFKNKKIFLGGGGLEGGGHYINEGTTLLSNSQLRAGQVPRISGDRMQLNTGLTRHNNLQDRTEFKVGTAAQPGPGWSAFLWNWKKENFCSEIMYSFPSTALPLLAALTADFPPTIKFFP